MGDTEQLRRRRMLASVARLAAPAWGCCYRCGMPWKFTTEHLTPYKRERGGGGCFPLCEECWNQLTPVERLPFYECLMRRWEVDKPVPAQERAAILKAVLDGR